MKYYVADAFTDEVFKGNPAGICVLEDIIPDETMQKIAFENNLSETAFLRKTGETYSLRWFTPTFEIDLCGHATLASAFIVMTYLEPTVNIVTFDTMSGAITVKRKGDSFEMSFPVRCPKEIPVTDEISESVGFVPREIYSERDLYILTDSQADVEGYIPDYDKLKKLDKWLGIVIKGKRLRLCVEIFLPRIKA